jgi:hypothetical protein
VLGHSARVQLTTVLLRQAGVLSLAQARACGLSDDAVRRRVAAGAWTQVHARVFLVAGHPRTDSARVWAASLWSGHSGVLSGPAAAYVHGMLPRAPRELQVTVPRATRRRPAQGTALRRRDLDSADRTIRAGVPVTGAELTVLETTLALPDGAVFLDRALQKHVGLPGLVAAYHRNLGTRGWSGLRPLLVAAHDRTASQMERRFVAILRGAGFAGWVANLRIGTRKADVAFVEAGVAVLRKALHKAA